MDAKSQRLLSKGFLTTSDELNGGLPAFANELRSQRVDKKRLREEDQHERRVKAAGVATQIANTADEGGYLKVSDGNLRFLTVVGYSCKIHSLHVDAADGVAADASQSAAAAGSAVGPAVAAAAARRDWGESTLVVWTGIRGGRPYPPKRPEATADASARVADAEDDQNDEGDDDGSDSPGHRPHAPTGGTGGNTAGARPPKGSRSRLLVDSTDVRLQCGRWEGFAKPPRAIRTATAKAMWAVADRAAREGRGRTAGGGTGAGSASSDAGCETSSTPDRPLPVPSASQLARLGVTCAVATDALGEGWSVAIERDCWFEAYRDAGYGPVGDVVTSVLASDASGAAAAAPCTGHDGPAAPTDTAQASSLTAPATATSAEALLPSEPAVIIWLHPFVVMPLPASIATLAPATTAAGAACLATASGAPTATDTARSVATVVTAATCPSTAAQAQLIATTARKVGSVAPAQAGQLELLLRVRQGDVPAFSFLRPDDPLHAYYQHCKARAAVEHGHGTLPGQAATAGQAALSGSATGTAPITGTAIDWPEPGQMAVAVRALDSTTTAGGSSEADGSGAAAGEAQAGSATPAVTTGFGLVAYDTDDDDSDNSDEGSAAGVTSGATAADGGAKMGGQGAGAATAGTGMGRGLVGYGSDSSTGEKQQLGSAAAVAPEAAYAVPTDPQQAEALQRRRDKLVAWKQRLQGSSTGVPACASPEVDAPETEAAAASPASAEAAVAPSGLTAGASAPADVEFASVADNGVAVPMAGQSADTAPAPRPRKRTRFTDQSEPEPGSGNDAVPAAPPDVTSSAAGGTNDGSGSDSDGGSDNGSGGGLPWLRATKPISSKGSKTSGPQASTAATAKPAQPQIAIRLGPALDPVASLLGQSATVPQRPAPQAVLDVMVKLLGHARSAAGVIGAAGDAGAATTDAGPAVSGAGAGAGTAAPVPSDAPARLALFVTMLAGREKSNVKFSFLQPWSPYYGDWHGRLKEVVEGLQTAVQAQAHSSASAAAAGRQAQGPAKVRRVLVVASAAASGPTPISEAAVADASAAAASSSSSSSAHTDLPGEVSRVALALRAKVQGPAAGTGSAEASGEQVQPSPTATSDGGPAQPAGSSATTASTTGAASAATRAQAQPPWLRAAIERGYYTDRDSDGDLDD